MNYKYTDASYRNCQPGISHSAVASDAVIDPSESVPCHKESGSGSRLRKWSRVHQFIVKGGGHIDTWQPLFRYVDQQECQ